MKERERGREGEKVGGSTRGRQLYKADEAPRGSLYIQTRYQDEGHNGARESLK